MADYRWEPGDLEEYRDWADVRVIEIRNEGDR